MSMVCKSTHLGIGGIAFDRLKAQILGEQCKHWEGADFSEGDAGCGYGKEWCTNFAGCEDMVGIRIWWV